MPPKLRPALLAAPVLLVPLWYFMRPRAAPPPMRFGIWYWHSPFRLSKSESSQLDRMGIRQVFVRAGTFQKADRGIRLTRPQEWASRADGLDIHLVFNFAYDIVRAFEKIPNEAMVESVVAEAWKQRTSAERAGLRVAGLQLDLDCPTRLLPKYADVLKGIRRRLDRTPLSVTALPTWFGSREVQRVADSVDFLVPQYYESKIPHTLDQFAPISRLSAMERGLRAAGRTGAPFYAGIPAYGHALVFDNHGKLLGTFHDLSVREAALHPAFRLGRTYPADSDGHAANPDRYIGEDICELDATPQETYGRYRVVYDLPTPEMVRQHLALLSDKRPSNCLGAILFRYPEKGETETLAPVALESALRGEKPHPNLAVRYKVSAAPWELIDSGRPSRGMPLDLTLFVTNTGNASTFFKPDSLGVSLHFDHPGIEEASRGAFDSVESFWIPSATPDSRNLDSPVRASVARANVLRFEKLQLAPGETARIGPIRLSADGPGRAWGDWSAASIGGFETMRGEIKPFALKGGEEGTR